MVEHPELAVSLIDPEPFTPGEAAQQRIWAFLERDLRQLSGELGIPLTLQRGTD
jgi:hypothetical protein